MIFKDFTENAESIVQLNNLFFQKKISEENWKIRIIELVKLCDLSEPQKFSNQLFLMMKFGHIDKANKLVSHLKGKRITRKGEKIIKLFSKFIKLIMFISIIWFIVQISK